MQRRLAGVWGRVTREIDLQEKGLLGKHGDKNLSLRKKLKKGRRGGTHWHSQDWEADTGSFQMSEITLWPPHTCIHTYRHPHMNVSPCSVTYTYACTFTRRGKLNRARRWNM